MFFFFVFEKVCFKETYCDMNEKGRKDFSLASYQYLPSKLQYQASIRDQVELNQKDIDGGLPWQSSGLLLWLRP